MTDGADPGRHWSRTLWAMVAVQFIIGAAFSIVPPVLPLILPTVGVTEPGAMRIWSGFLVGVTPLAAALMSPQWGRWVDRVDRRVILLITCAAAAACTTAMTFATAAWQFLLLRFSMGLFGGHSAAAMSIVGAAAPPERLGRALGWLAMGQLGGALLGPLLGGILADAFGNPRAPFLAAGLGALLVAGAIAFVPAARPRGAHQDDPSTRADHRSITHRHPDVRTLIAILFLTQCAIMMSQPIISLRVLELVGHRADVTTLAGLAFSAVGLSGLIAAPSLGALSDAVGAKKLLFVVAVMATVLTLPQGFAADYLKFVLERFLAGLMLCAMIPVMNALVGKAVREQDRGRAFGMTAGAAFMGAFVGPVVGGLIASHFGITAVFLVSGGILAVNATCIGAFLWPGSIQARPA